MEVFGQTFRSKVIKVREGEKYAACTFYDCWIQTPPRNGKWSFTDCTMEGCTIEIVDVAKEEQVN